MNEKYLTLAHRIRADLETLVSMTTDSGTDASHASDGQRSPRAT
jgi:hypothetical protein